MVSHSGSAGPWEAGGRGAAPWSSRVFQGQGGDSGTGLSSFQDRLRESALAS